MTTMTQIERQLELEDEATALGAERYRASVAKAKENGYEGSLPPLLALTRKVMEPTVEMIQADRESVSAKKYGAGRSGSVTSFLARFTPEELAFVTIRCVFDGISQQRRLQRVAADISGHLEDIILNEVFEEQSPYLKRWLDKDLEPRNKRHTRVVMRLAANRNGVEYTKLSVAEGQRVGVRLIEIFRQATGLVDIRAISNGRRSISMLVATDELMQWLDEQNERCELLSPMLLPMVCRPVSWTRPTGGGYLKLNKHKAKVVKTNNAAYLQELENYDLSRVYRALNALQDTPWRINKGVLEVMQEVWNMGGNLGGLPRRDLEEMPAKPADIDTNAEARREWRREAAKVHDINNHLRSKRIAAGQRLWIAEKFANEEAIYFPWQMDWRGRAYPVSSLVHPQADDAGRGLIQFAEGKPLGESGVYWLAVHIANLFGVDKVSYDERVAWVLANEEAILDSGMRPLDGQRFWTDADKPWCALAACIEWVGYRMQGEEYVSHLPIAMDGSCNGLQNLSAMLLDEVGGAAVNLVPSEKPNDIYARVAELVACKVDRLNDPDLVCWKGRINRSLVKRPVMTMPYGSTQVGMRSQLLEEMRKAIEAGDLEALPVDAQGEPIRDNYQQCNALAELVYRSVGEVVIAAREVMDWLQAAARVAAKNELPLYWDTPLGLPVQQRYMKSNFKELDFAFGKARFRVSIAEASDKIDKRKMANGISPNFVHSMDAAHMMLTVLYCLDEGVTSFAMIHDSYGTHAADCEKLYNLLRTAFVDIYSEGVLELFREGLVNQLPPELAAEIPPLPSKGSLELEQVMESPYFFA